MSIQKMSARAAALLACAALLTACNSDDDGTPADTTAPPGSTAASTTPAADPTTATTAPDAAGGGSVPDGSRLKALLPTATTVPKGWKLDDSAAFDTGATVNSPDSPQLPDEECAQALTNSGAQTLTSDYSAAYATTGLTDPNGGGSTVVFNSYQPGAAAKQMAEVSALVKRCASYSSKSSSGKTVKVTATATPVSGLGDTSLDITIQPVGNYVGSEIVLVQSGTIIMGVDQSDAAGRTTPLAPVAKQLAAVLPMQ